ncbi:MAG: nucleotide exchange factor GrpE [Cellvibrionales bacterium TMED122]|nr:nucleotide exchange factor GrpE [Halieaceae bacterium]OUV66726.1 MAG: nucleotide exchange factor GrpE [Cellvibrionales bacterium TMED122]
MVDERPDEPTEEEGDPHHAEAADSAEAVKGDDEGLVDTEGDAAVPTGEDSGVAALAAELEAAKDAALRARADAMNVQRRAEQEIEKARKFALERFSGDLLSVVDNLERALESSGDEQGGAALAEGVELTRKGFMDVLAKYGVEAVDPTGEPFDPETAQAMSMVEQPDAEPNSVVAVMQKGYLLNGRLLRPAMVMVAKAPSAE